MDNFYQRFVETATRYPDKPAVALQGTSADATSYTYAELRHVAEHLGAWLQRAGIPAEARCAILANNSPRWVAAYLGIMAAGCVAVPLDTAFKAQQVAKLLEDSGASLLFVDASHLETGRAAWTAVDPARQDRIFVIDSTTEVELPNFDVVLASSGTSLIASQANGDDIAVLLYTSG